LHACRSTLEDPLEYIEQISQFINVLSIPRRSSAYADLHALRMM
jgi:DNA primase (EC 2.7.7.-)